MSLLLKRASAMSMAASLIIALYSAHGSGAAAQEKSPEGKVLSQAPSEPAPPSAADGSSTTDSDAAVTPSANPSTLADLVAAEPQVQKLTAEMNCLAGAIYFEARSESLDGQLAVGRVIVARTKSGRFPTSYCGVVYQPAQFSFVRRHHMPAIKTASHTWRNAVALARIAHEGRWQTPAEGALFFHAKRVSPHWRNTVKVAQIENHVFYR